MLIPGWGHCQRWDTHRACFTSFLVMSCPMSTESPSCMSDSLLAMAMAAVLQGDTHPNSYAGPVMKGQIQGCIMDEMLVHHRAHTQTERQPTSVTMWAYPCLLNPQLFWPIHCNQSTLGCNGTQKSWFGIYLGCLRHSSVFGTTGVSVRIHAFARYLCTESKDPYQKFSVGIGELLHS